MARSIALQRVCDDPKNAERDVIAGHEEAEMKIGAARRSSPREGEAHQRA